MTKKQVQKKVVEKSLFEKALENRMQELIWNKTHEMTKDFITAVAPLNEFIRKHRAGVCGLEEQDMTDYTVRLITAALEEESLNDVRIPDTIVNGIRDNLYEKILNLPLKSGPDAAE